MSVGGRNLGAPPGSRVDDIKLKGTWRIVHRLCGDRLRIFGRVRKRIVLTRWRRRRADYLGATRVFARVESDVKIDAERSGDLFPAIGADTFAGHAAHNFAYQMAKG